MNDTFETIKKNVITYFKGVKTEWGKITWPEKHQGKTRIEQILPNLQETYYSQRNKIA